jgi:hypothetical protein
VLLHLALQEGISEHRQVALMLTAALLGLAILEHWMMVLPMPTTWLWKWAIRSSTPADRATGFIDAPSDAAPADLLEPARPRGT